MTAGVTTLRSKPGPFPGSETLVLDCPHGQTRGVLMGRSDDLARQAAIDALVQRHTIEEGCGCVASLRPTSAEARA